MISKDKYDELHSRPTRQEAFLHAQAAREDERMYGSAARALRALLETMTYDNLRRGYVWDERAIVGMDPSVACLISKELSRRALDYRVNTDDTPSPDDRKGQHEDDSR